ncbi:hypothetical protein OUZ56_012383 [Daphnia magna]|uniref:Uncharacterized protein n=1 Tax=Daphnia magna TaxID=35525 RepID=A0ABQ9Z2W5_9CRUS|nr:hypothetical protein OUZ56_012383 [Daphnia magna]
MPAVIHISLRKGCIRDDFLAGWGCCCWETLLLPMTQLFRPPFRREFFLASGKVEFVTTFLLGGVAAAGRSCCDSVSVEHLQRVTNDEYAQAYDDYNESDNR